MGGVVRKIGFVITRCGIRIKRRVRDMGHPRTFEAKACRGVKVAYDGDARDRRFR